MTLYASSFLGGAVSSVQRLNVTINSSLANTDFTIAPVNVGKTAVLLTHSRSGNTSIFAPVLVNGTTLRLARTGNAISGTFNYTATVIDFGPLVKNVQRGMIAANTSPSATIATVNPDKCIVLIDLSMSQAGVSPSINQTYTLSTNNLSLSSDLYANRYWQVIEFY